MINEMTTDKETLALQQLVVKELVKEQAIELFETSVDERGLPVFGVIEIEDENGNLKVAYKKEKLFNVEDYRKAANYQAKLASNHKELADYYAAEFEKRQSAKSAAF